MAEEAQEVSDNLFGLPVVKQLLMLIGVAVAVAIGFAMVLWMQEPDYGVLYPSLDGQDAGAVAENLTQMGVPYTVQASTGAILVPKDQVANVKIKLAAMGLPQSNSRGYEMLEKSAEFGTSQFMELARFRRALETELARTISSMQRVKSARVHLAIPKEPVFVRDRRKSSASVFIDLYAGRRLTKLQVDAIVNMVAASIPEMQPEDVTVVDQKGSLLTAGDDTDSFAITGKQLDIKQRIEQEYINRINSLLAPILGDNRIRTQVTIDVDFTREEATAEEFNPDKNSIRSAQYVKLDTGADGQTISGVPGALSNQPPTEGTAKANAEAQAAEQAAKLRSTENFELDKTISYTKKQPWSIQRLSIAVAVDDAMLPGEGGQLQRTPLEEEELERLNQLVRNAVGYTQARGDVVEVINVSFVEPEKIGEIPPVPMFEQPWFLNLMKYLAGGIGLLVLVFGVFKPVLQSLIAQEAKSKDLHDPALDFDIDPSIVEENMLKLPEPSSAYGARMESVRNMVREHPGKVAEVVMDWVGDD